MVIYKIGISEFTTGISLIYKNYNSSDKVMNTELLSEFLTALQNLAKEIFQEEISSISTSLIHIVIFKKEIFLKDVHSFFTIYAIADEKLKREFITKFLMLIMTEFENTIKDITLYEIIEGKKDFTNLESFINQILKTYNENSFREVLPEPFYKAIHEGNIKLDSLKNDEDIRDIFILHKSGILMFSKIQPGIFSEINIDLLNGLIIALLDFFFEYNKQIRQNNLTEISKMIKSTKSFKAIVENKYLRKLIMDVFQTIGIYEPFYLSIEFENLRLSSIITDNFKFTSITNINREEQLIIQKMIFFINRFSIRYGWDLLHFNGDVSHYTNFNKEFNLSKDDSLRFDTK